MSLVLDGSAGVTFPTGSGTQGAQSKVLQVVNATYSTQVTTTSSSFVTTGLTASITPLFATSKILVIATVPTSSSTSGQNSTLTIYRNGSNIAPNSNLAALQGGSAQFVSLCLTILDSPVSTSATTYTIYGFASGGSTATFNSLATGNSSSSITLMEIAQ